MKLTFGFLVVLALLAISARAEESVAVIQRIFRRLHQGPPPPPPATRNHANVQTLYIKQKLDQFNKADKRTWQMRYMANDEFYEEGGPFFIFVGGEWGISSDYITGGHMYDMAGEHNGYLFYTEHRYYGKSRPTSDLSNENLKYLNVRQALADLAHFIRTMRATVPGATNSKVILVGGSYAGTMVTWFKKEYPDLAVGCWASGAPLFAKVDFTEYTELVGESIARVGGVDCYNRIQNGFAKIESMLVNKRGAKVKAMLKLCNNFDENNYRDIWSLFIKISYVFKDLVQRHYAPNIQKACYKIMKGDDDVTGVIGYLATQFYTDKCNYLPHNEVDTEIMNLAHNSSNSHRQWQYQTCNEFGWFVAGGYNHQPFGSKFPVQWYTTMCRGVYGDKYTYETIHKKVAETNKRFGGLNPRVDNVYFTYGENDSWRMVGIQDERVTVLKGYGHCKDLWAISANDTQGMRASKEKVAELVREWLSGEGNE